jgi:hypothetical protein
VVRDVAARTLGRIELPQTPIEISDQPLQACPQRRLAVTALREHHRQHVRDRSLLDDERAVHIGFAEPQLGIEQHATLGCGGGKADCDRGTATVAEGENCPARGRHPQITSSDKVSQCHSKKPIHRRSPCARIAYGGEMNPPCLRRIWSPPAAMTTVWTRPVRPAGLRNGSIRTKSANVGNAGWVLGCLGSKCAAS